MRLPSSFLVPVSLTFGGALLFAAVPSVSQAAVYSQSFDVADGTTGNGLGDGSMINGAGDGGFVPAVRGNVLELTSAAATSTSASFVTPAVADSSRGFTVSFDVFVQDTAGGNPPADGFAFVYTNAITSTSLFGEEGPPVVAGNHLLVWEYDTWNNLAAPDFESGIFFGSNGLYGDDWFGNPGLPLADGGTFEATVTLSWFPDSGASLLVDGNPVFTDVSTPGFVAGDDYLFAIAGRTGGATETLQIDNLRIATVPEPGAAALALLAAPALMLRRRRR